MLKEPDRSSILDSSQVANTHTPGEGGQFKARRKGDNETQVKTAGHHTWGIETPRHQEQHKQEVCLKRLTKIKTLHKAPEFCHCGTKSYLIM